MVNICSGEHFWIISSDIFRQRLRRRATVGFGHDAVVGDDNDAAIGLVLISDHSCNAVSGPLPAKNIQ